ncbi:hypothetical protein, unlikely [Trypanosoma brucei gambiense DAL972]|uniref:Uncharacterized protein n=1 Tax=Trypanosoma brucei gambiense (strain MHOM/CI/86/DAL972) TaxID=679716 RepID=D0A777_TRYB9|nr:hypothetical protein, unlikely [Trypanosoma brucei gambiense DAL972]CBH17528.1 hypothetical protein, unlikely [Trypanosoma brucei gambiense DAL972]|eukprot:XP_011779792.1 hypothetical protein, unlikely [Trypanosoma brucei gambiense DAL972]
MTGSRTSREVNHLRDNETVYLPLDGCFSFCSHEQQLLYLHTEIKSGSGDQRQAERGHYSERKVASFPSCEHVFKKIKHISMSCAASTYNESSESLSYSPSHRVA